MEKQTQINYARLNINLPKELKDEFIAVAKLKESDASKLIRAWIKKYLAENKV